MEIGEQVEVHTRYNNSWAPGFEIAEVVDRGYRVRRICDATLLPDLTGESDVRPAPPTSAWHPDGPNPSASSLRRRSEPR